MDANLNQISYHETKYNQSENYYDSVPKSGWLAETCFKPNSVSRTMSTFFMSSGQISFTLLRFQILFKIKESNVSLSQLMNHFIQCIALFLFRRNLVSVFASVFVFFFQYQYMPPLAFYKQCQISKRLLKGGFQEKISDSAQIGLGILNYISICYTILGSFPL